MMIVLTIVAILATMLLPVYGRLRERAQKAQCMANLRNLYVATDLYIQRNGSWPQIFLKNYTTDEEYANAWITALEPFGITRQTWICPTIQELLHNPAYNDASNARLITFRPASTINPPHLINGRASRGLSKWLTFTETAISSSSPTAARPRRIMC
jgi:type II secretory pathway pseudopilin PulG